MSNLESFAQEENGGITNFLDLMRNLAQAERYLRPQSKEGLIVASKDSQFWLEPGYPHEHLLISAWASLVEKRSLKRLSAEGVESLGKILGWISSLDQEKAIFEKPLKRKTEPLLLREEVVRLMEEQAQKLKNPVEFMKIDDWENFLISIVRGYVLILNRNKIFSLSVSAAENSIVRNLFPK